MTALPAASSPEAAEPRLVIVVAAAENGVIGREGGLPWRLSTDLRRFRELTWGKPVVMGRRTWDSIGRPLPGRRSVVLTGQAGWTAPGAVRVGTWAEAKRVSADLARAMEARSVAVIGGAALFDLALPEADMVHLTRVHAHPAGDVLFPDPDPAIFRETFREAHGAGSSDDHPFTFIDLERNPQPLNKVAAGR